jgi:hypothetical protein
MADNLLYKWNLQDGMGVSDQLKTFLMDDVTVRLLFSSDRSLIPIKEF